MAVPKKGWPMEWTTPSFEEVDLGCEISAYSAAVL